MAAKEGSAEGEMFVYRISTAEEWEYLQKNESTLGGDFDKSSGFVHLSSLNQVFPSKISSSFGWSIEARFRILSLGLFLVNLIPGEVDPG